MSMRAIVRFAFETAIAAVVLVMACSLLSWLVRDSIGLVFFVGIGIVPVFLIIVLFLFFTARFAALRGLFGAIATLSIVQGIAMGLDAARAEARMSMTAPQGPRPVGAVDLADFLNACDNMACVEVLAKTGADVVLRDHAYRLVRGDACRAGALRPMYFEFLKAGYAGMCAAKIPVSRSPELLTVEQISCDVWRDGYALCDELPRSYTGYIISVRMEDDAGSRLLDRWLVGEISPISDWFGLVGLAELRVGDRYRLGNVFSRALGTQLQGGGVTGNGDLEEVLTELESFLDDPATARSAAYHLNFLSAARGKENPALLRAHILRLLQSSDTMRVRAGLELITGQSHVNVRDIRPKIEQLAQSADSLISDSARRALMNIPTAEQKIPE
jgi:hypothetical protein